MFRRRVSEAKHGATVPDRGQGAGPAGRGAGPGPASARPAGAVRPVPAAHGQSWRRGAGARGGRAVGTAAGRAGRERTAPGPGVELLARRPGLLRRRQGRRRGDRPGVPASGRDGPGRARVPGPGGALPGRAGQDPAVPRHRGRAARGRQHPRDRAAHRAGQQDRLRGQRPGGPAARQGAARQPDAGQHAGRRRSATPTPTCATWPRCWPARAARSAFPGRSR